MLDDIKGSNQFYQRNPRSHVSFRVTEVADARELVSSPVVTYIPNIRGSRHYGVQVSPTIPGGKVKKTLTQRRKSKRQQNY